MRMARSVVRLTEIVTAARARLGESAGELINGAPG